MTNHPNRKKGPKGPDLIQSAIDTLTAAGHTARTASATLVESINGDLGTAYDTARWGQWRRAERPIPQPVQNWLLRMSIAHVIAQCGGVPPTDDESLDRLASMLCQPEKSAPTDGGMTA